MRLPSVFARQSRNCIQFFILLLVLFNGTTFSYAQIYAPSNEPFNHPNYEDFARIFFPSIEIDLKQEISVVDFSDKGQTYIVAFYEKHTDPCVGIVKVISFSDRKEIQSFPYPDGPDCGFNKDGSPMEPYAGDKGNQLTNENIVYLPNGKLMLAMTYYMADSNGGESNDLIFYLWDGSSLIAIGPEGFDSNDHWVTNGSFTSDYPNKDHLHISSETLVYGRLRGIGEISKIVYELPDDPKVPWKVIYNQVFDYDIALGDINIGRTVSDNEIESQIEFDFKAGNYIVKNFKSEADSVVITVKDKNVIDYRAGDKQPADTSFVYGGIGGKLIIKGRPQASTSFHIEEVIH